MQRWDSRTHPKYLVEVQKPNGEELPADEPLFVLRARDPLAAVCVRQYAELKRGLTDSRDYHALVALAGEMRDYEEKRLPDAAFAGVLGPVRIIDILRDPDTPGWLKAGVHNALADGGLRSREEQVPRWVRETLEVVLEVDPVDAANVLEVITACDDDLSAYQALLENPTTPFWASALVRAMVAHGLEDAAPWAQILFNLMEDRCAQLAGHAAAEG